jgi:hypothetical protein
VRYWQKRLRLSHWDLDIKVIPGGKGIAGSCAFDPTNLSATITVTTQQQDLTDLMDSIIHELMHLHFWFVDHEGKEGTPLEQAFTRICRTMAELYLETAGDFTPKDPTDSGQGKFRHPA